MENPNGDLPNRQSDNPGRPLASISGRGSECEEDFGNQSLTSTRSERERNRRTLRSVPTRRVRQARGGKRLWDYKRLGYADKPYNAIRPRPISPELRAFYAYLKAEEDRANNFWGRVARLTK